MVLSIQQIRCRISIIQDWGVVMNLTENLKKIRIERKLSQMDVAEILGTTQQVYSRYELGTNEIPVRHVITLCKFYGISSDWLLGLKDEM